MTAMEKKRLDLKAKFEQLEKDSRQLLADIREKKVENTGETKRKLEQYNLDMEQCEQEISAIQQEQDSEDIRALTDRLEATQTRVAEGGATLMERSVPATQRVEDYDALRNSHPLFKEWNGMGDFFRAVHHAGRSAGRMDARLAKFQEERAPTMFGELIDQDGGFLVPPQYSSVLLMNAFATGKILSRCRRIPMTSNKIMINAVDETSRANGSRMGGIQAYWVAEGSPPTATKGKFRQITLEPQGLAAATYASDEILADTTALGAWIAMVFPEEITHTFENAIWSGDGAGKPQGFTNSPATIAVAAEGGQGADTIVFDNVRKMRARQFSPNYAWFVSKDSRSALELMAMPVGTGGVPVYMPAAGVSVGPYDSLYSHSVVEVEQAAKLGDLYDIVSADLSYYLIGQVGGVSSATSIHVKFLEFEQTFRWKIRVDGQPWWTSALTPQNGGPTESPFVTLAAR